MGLALLIYETGVVVKIMVEINGAIFSLLYVYLTPVFIHLSCLYRERSSGEIEGDDEHNAQIVPNECECEVKYRSKWTMWADTVFCVLIVIVALYFSIRTMTEMVARESSGEAV